MDSISQELKTLPITIKSPAELPKEFKALSEAYQKTESNVYIKPELRSSLALITGTSSAGSKQDLYILFVKGGTNDVAVQDFTRNFLTVSKKGSRRFNAERLYFAQLQPDNKVIEHINNQIKNSSGVKNSSKTQNDVDFAEEILLEAFRQKTSDIHIESQGNGMATVRYRINKELHLSRWITQKEAETFGNVCYSTFAGNAEDRGTARGVYKSSSLLEGIFQRKILDPRTENEIYIKGRMMNLSHNDGTKSDFIIRIIDKNKNNKAKRFNDMGFSEHATRLLRELETISSGAILTCGVTGSGKSTTQTNMVQHERDRSGGRRKIIMIEDPVEYDIELITQITAGEKKEDTPEDSDFSFSNINKKNMRADPDSLGYGEIRDTETAKNMIKGALTGHLVYGTIHTSGALEVFERLHEMGASMGDICRYGFLRLVLFQHLLPTICPHCSIPYSREDGVPEKYSELFVATMEMASQMKVTTEQMLKYNDIAKSTNTSLFRILQRKGVIDSRTVKQLQEKRLLLNESSDQDAFMERLNNIIEQSTIPEKDLNIRFRGDGCKHCLAGQTGVTPAAEVLIPDSEFLSLIKSGQKANARLYWRTRLGGKTASEDCYDRILRGIIDPRTSEEHLGKLGE